MCPWFFNVYKDDVVREENATVLGKWLELLRQTMAGFVKSAVICRNSTSGCLREVVA